MSEKNSCGIARFPCDSFSSVLFTSYVSHLVISVTATVKVCKKFYFYSKFEVLILNMYFYVNLFRAIYFNFYF